MSWSFSGVGIDMSHLTSRGQLRENIATLADELRLLRLRGDRAVLCVQTVASVVLAVVLADALELTDRWWVALSAYAVFRAGIKVVLRRGAERMLGTMAGAALGALLAFVLPPHPAYMVPALAMVAGIGIYGMLGSSLAYSWILGTVTALMVLGGATQLQSVPTFALERVIDVGVGTASTMSVALIWAGVHRWTRRAHPAAGVQSMQTSPASFAAATWRRLKAWQALQGAVAIALLACVDSAHSLPSFSQAMVSVVAVLLVPMPALFQGTAARNVQARMINRVLGCLCAALIAAPLLPLMAGTPWLCLGVLAAGVWLAAHVQSGPARVSYIGTQFGVGFIMVFVQDHGWSPDTSNTWHRLAGIVLALAALSLVMLLASLLRRRLH